MKKLLVTIFLLTVVALEAAAQEDFSSQYLMKLKGAVYYPGDLSSGCGSRIDVYLIYEDGTVSHVYAREHAGDWHYFDMEIFLESNNKVRQIVCYGRAYNERDGWTDTSGCGSRKIGEGNGYIDLDLNRDYPCFNQTFTGKFPPYHPQYTTISVDIQPLSKKSARLTMNADLRNNHNEDFINDPLNDAAGTGIWLFDGKSPFTFTIAAESGARPFDTFWSEMTESAGGQTISRQRVVTYGSWPPTSLKVTVDAEVPFGTTMGDEHATWDAVMFTKPTHVQFNLPLTDMVNPGTKTVDFTLYPAAAPSQVTLTTTSYTLPIRYGPDDTNILPYKSRINIVGPVGNPASFYHWVYSLDGTTWKDFPARYQGQQRLQLSGYDLEGEAFMEHPIANRFVKLIVDCNGGESNILTLSGRISAPDIASVTPMPDRCFDKPNDGAFKITFAKPLYVDQNGDQEHLTIILKDPLITNKTVAQFPDITLDGQNSFICPRALPSDKKYKLELVSTYLGTAVYTGDPVNHTASFELVRPQPVSSVITPEAVHCYSGADGKINLSAQGGVGNYRYDYVPSGTEDSVHVSMAQQLSDVVTFLPQGTYLFKVYDGNNCGDRGGVKSIVVTQPATPMSIAYSKITDPLGFGYSNGYIETILDGGTPLADKSYTTEWQGTTDLINAIYDNAPLSEGYQVNIDSVADGYYILKAYDSQYPLAHPDHRTGCYVISEQYHVIQPPPIVVAVSEYHYVTCNGYDDGEILANARGGVKIAGALPYQYDWQIEENGVFRSITQADSIATQLRSGVYRIRITDKNQVKKHSAAFTLVQPDLLNGQITTTPVSCSSGMDGTAIANIQGGTLPYSYEWSEGSTTPQIGNLVEGLYFTFVTDVRGCITTTSARVASPNILHVDSLLRAPQCFGYANGGIDITITEGTAPYRYEWSTGATTEDIDGLPEGTYSVMIVDANNCRSFRNYQLNDPEPIRVALGKERYLCNDQSYNADASLSDANATYQWTGPQGYTATTGVVKLTQEGTYHVLATDSNGCEGEGSLTLKRQGLDIDAEFVVSTQAFAAEDITLLNISTTESDSVQWWTSDAQSAQFATKEDNKAVVIFSSEGVYTIYMKTFLQGCEAEFTKTITVLGTEFSTTPQTESPLIENFSVAPNPTSGTFTVTVGMQEVSSIRLRLISIGDSKVVSEREAQGSSEYELDYTVNLAAGTYLLVLETAKGSAIQKVMVY